MNPRVDFYFSKAGKWQKELENLRTIVLDCGLNEELKWGVPCYTLGASNICLIHVFKAYCAVLFVKGALLEDTNNILVQQTENVQSARQARFTNVEQIVGMKAILKAYIYQAIEIEKAGLKVPVKKTSAYHVPEEFKMKLDTMPALKSAFEALTPGRQRGYLLYFSAPKQSSTREARVDKSISHILAGKGLED